MEIILAHFPWMAYGVVGHLPWQNDQSVAFGAELGSRRLLEIVNQIKTFTESVDPKSSEILAIRDNITNANNVVYLGFAYHKLNMKLLMSDSPAINPLRTRLCFGTAKGISKSDCESIKVEFEDFYKSIKKLDIRNDLDCYLLFKEYWRSLILN